MERFVNYYDVLEVAPHASDPVIRKAYLSLVQQLHPDKFRGSNKTYANDRLRDVTRAYEVLSEPTTRRRFDRDLARHQARAENPWLRGLSAPLHRGIRIALFAVGAYVLARIFLVVAGGLLVSPYAKVVAAFLGVCLLYVLLRKTAGRR